MLMGVTRGSTHGLLDSETQTPGRRCDGYRDADGTQGKVAVGIQVIDGVDKEGAMRMSLLKTEKEREQSRLGGGDGQGE